MNCSFCGKPKEQVRVLIAGPNNVFVCDECVLVSVRVMVDTAIQAQFPQQPQKTDQ